jgi:hypothetical protein
VNFHSKRRTDLTHQSTTDHHARLAKKGAGKEAELCYLAHAFLENRNTLWSIFRSNRPMDTPAARRDRDGQ